MKIFLIVLIFLFLNSCSSKPKTVFICGDHVCVNKDEAEKYFDENLTLEVQIIDKNKKNDVSLVELNLKGDLKKNRQISIKQKNKTKKEVKILNNNEIKQIKKEIKEKKKIKKIAKKDVINKKEKKSKNIISKDNILKDKRKKNLSNKDKKNLKNETIIQKGFNKEPNKVVDVCTILEKCSIDEISKYLLKQGKKKDFPDITTR